MLISCPLTWEILWSEWQNWRPLVLGLHSPNTWTPLSRGCTMMCNQNPLEWILLWCVLNSSQIWCRTLYHNDDAIRKYGLLKMIYSSNLGPTFNCRREAYKCKSLKWAIILCCWKTCAFDSIAAAHCQTVHCAAPLTLLENLTPPLLSWFWRLPCWTDYSCHPFTMGSIIAQQTTCTSSIILNSFNTSCRTEISNVTSVSSTKN